MGEDKADEDKDLAVGKYNLVIGRCALQLMDKKGRASESGRSASRWMRKSRALYHTIASYLQASCGTPRVYTTDATHQRAPPSRSLKSCYGTTKTIGRFH